MTESVEWVPDDYSSEGDAPTLVGGMGDGDHRLCAGVLKEMARRVGLDLHISTERPLVAGPYTTEPMVCPHGTPFWFEPTGEQIAYYVKNRIP